MKNDEFIYFATGNKHKFIEMKKVADDFGISLRQLDESKIEEKDKTIQETALENAERISNKTNKVVIVDDTGIFFKAYNNFPGQHPKMIYNMIGYEGLLKLVEGKNRECEFVTAAALCFPNQKPMLFEGKMKLTIAKDVHCADRDVHLYERILLTDNGGRFCDITTEEKNLISHRANAFRKLFKFLKNNS